MKTYEAASLVLLSSCLIAVPSNEVTPAIAAALGGTKLLEMVQHQETQGRERLEHWCKVALSVQAGRCSALQKLLLQTELGKPMPVQQLELEAAKFGEEAERQRVAVQATESSRRQRVAAATFDADDASKDVQALQRAGTKLGSGRLLESLLIGARAEEKRRREKVALLQQLAGKVDPRQEIARLDKEHTAKRASIVLFWRQQASTERSMEVLTAAVQDEAVYFADLQTSCQLGKEIFDRIETGPVAVLNHSLTMPVTPGTDVVDDSAGLDTGLAGALRGALPMNDAVVSSVPQPVGPAPLAAAAPQSSVATRTTSQPAPAAAAAAAAASQAKAAATTATAEAAEAPKPVAVKPAMPRPAAPKPVAAVRIEEQSVAAVPAVPKRHLRQASQPVQATEVAVSKKPTPEVSPPTLSENVDASGADPVAVQKPLGSASSQEKPKPHVVAKVSKPHKSSETTDADSPDADTDAAPAPPSSAPTHRQKTRKTARVTKPVEVPSAASLNADPETAEPLPSSNVKHNKHKAVADSESLDDAVDDETEPPPEPKPKKHKVMRHAKLVPQSDADSVDHDVDSPVVAAPPKPPKPHAKHITHAKHARQAKHAKRTKPVDIAPPVDSDSSSALAALPQPAKPKRAAHATMKKTLQPADDDSLDDVNEDAAPAVTAPPKHHKPRAAKHENSVQLADADTLEDDTDSMPVQPQPKRKSHKVAKPVAPAVPPADSGLLDDDGDAAPSQPPTPKHPQHKKHAQPVQQLAESDALDDNDDAAGPPPLKKKADRAKKQSVQLADADSLDDSDTADAATPPTPRPAKHKKTRKKVAGSKPKLKETFMDGVYSSAAGDMPSGYSAWTPDGSSTTRPPIHVDSDPANQMKAMLGDGDDSSSADSATKVATASSAGHTASVPAPLPPAAPPAPPPVSVPLPAPPAPPVVQLESASKEDPFSDDSSSVSSKAVAAPTSPPSSDSAQLEEDGPPTRDSLMQQSHRGKKKKKNNGYNGAEDSQPGLPKTYAAWDPDDESSDAPKKQTSLQQMLTDFKNDDDDDAPPPPKKHRHRTAHRAPPTPAPHIMKGEDGVIYDDDDLPKHHGPSIMSDLQGGWKSFMGRGTKPSKPKQDPDIAIMNSLYANDGGLPKQYAAWSPTDNSGDQAPAAPARKEDTPAPSDGGPDAFSNAAKDLMTSFFQRASGHHSAVEGAIKNAVMKVDKAPIFLEEAAVQVSAVRAMAANLVLEQYAEVLQSPSLKQLARAKLSPPRIAGLWQRLQKMDPLTHLDAAPPPGKREAQAEQWCQYFETHAQAAIPVHNAVVQAEKASNELAEATARHSASMEEVAARTQLQKTLEQDVRSLTMLLKVTQQEQAVLGLHPVQDTLANQAVTAPNSSAKELMDLDGAVQSIRDSHVELVDLLQAALQKRSVALQAQRSKLVALLQSTKVEELRLAQKRAIAAQTQAGIEAARKRLATIQAACEATLGAQGHRQHAGHMEAHAIEVSLKVLHEK